MNYNLEDIYEKVSFLEYYDSFTERDFTEIAYEGFADCSYESGISRGVIIPHNADYVIKIPFSGYWDEDMYDIETGEYGMVVNFCGGAGPYYDDYCAEEIEIYNEIEDSPFKKYFLPLIWVMKVGNYNIYIQPKAEIFSESNKRYTNEESFKKARTVSNSVETTLVCTEWIAVLFEEYFNKNEETLVQFLQFLKDNNVDEDLHSSNVGFYNGLPAIIDYAGFTD